MLHQAGDYLAAAQAYALNRRLSPKGDFAEDALARQFEAAAEQGDLDQAKKLAEQYAKDFPNGRRAEAIREQLARLENTPSETQELPPITSDAPNSSEQSAP
jgi:outer membrane protein assembly factor BamD (BamD/ComL family)